MRNGDSVIAGTLQQLDDPSSRGFYGLPEPPSIFDQFEHVRQHPEFVFGTIFVRQDFPGANVPEDFSPRFASDALAERGSLLIGDLATYCEDCGVAVVPDPAGSEGVWVHDPMLGDEAYDLNEAHAARPPEGIQQ